MYFIQETGVAVKRGNMGQCLWFYIILVYFACEAGHIFVSGDPNILTGNHTRFLTEWNSVEILDGNNNSNFVKYSEENNFEDNKYQETYWLGIFKENDLKLTKIYSVLVIVAYTLVFIKGVVGNAVVIIVISTKPRMRTVTNLFILNLAVADMFVLVFCLPATLLANILKSWILGPFMCSGVTYVQAVSVIASAYSLVAISVDRCKAICQHSMSTRGFSKTQAKEIILLIWLVALILPLPWVYVFELQEYSGVMYCLEIWSNHNVGLAYFLIANLFCCYILPFILITIACLIIWWKVSHRKVPQNDSYPSSSPACQHVRNIHQKTKRGVRRMLVVVAFTFLLCWLPLYIIATFLELSSHFTETERAILSVVVPLAQWLAYWNSCANPVIYAFYNTNFRKAAKSLIPACCLKYCCGENGIGARLDQETGTQMTLKFYLYNRLKRNTFSSGSYYTANSNGSSGNSLRRSRHGSSRNGVVCNSENIMSTRTNKCVVQRLRSNEINGDNVTAV